MIRLFRRFLPILTVVLIAEPVQAVEDFDSSPLLCAFTEVIECDMSGECLEVLPEVVGLPDFITVDLAKKQLLEVAGESARSTKIDSVTSADGKVIFGGLDNGRGWSAVLSVESRLLSATITDDLVGFVVFGSCLPQP